MKAIVIEIMRSYLDSIKNTVSLTKDIRQEYSLIDDNISPLKLVEFMEECNIPKTAKFGYLVGDSDDCTDFGLWWYITVETTDEDRKNEVVKRFNLHIFPLIAEAYFDNGYKRTGFDSTELNKYNGTTLYHMFVNNKHDKLMEYINMHFTK